MPKKPLKDVIFTKDDFASHFITKRDFLNAFEQAVKILVDTKKRHEMELSLIKDTFDSLLKKADELRSNDSKDLKGQFADFEKRLMGKIETRLAQIKDGEDGDDGEDADEEAIIEAVLKRVVIPKPEDKELSVDDIEGLREELDKLKPTMVQRARGLFGGTVGGYSDNHVKFALGRLVQTETPSGDIDSVNKEYTVKNHIHTVLEFGINGMVIHDNEYTIAGNKITFTTAIPAGLSGLTFRIRYL